jgi:hypothetical protein
MSCTCCHNRKDPASRVLVAQERLERANPTRIGAAMEGLCERPPAFVPRWTGQRKESSSLEVHGFADASSRAYAAVVYLRDVQSNSNFQVSLICAKTKIVPVKTITIPRLELNAVVLLSRLLV